MSTCKIPNTSKWWDERMPEAVNLILKGYGLTELGAHFGKSTAAVAQALNKRGVSINVLRAKNKAECDKHHEEVITLANAMRQNRELRARVAELEGAIMSNCYDDPSTSGKRLMALVEQGE